MDLLAMAVRRVFEEQVLNKKTDVQIDSKQADTEKVAEAPLNYVVVNHK